MNFYLFLIRQRESVFIFFHILTTRLTTYHDDAI
jgi:hypothetical protein